MNRTDSRPKAVALVSLGSTAPLADVVKRFIRHAQSREHQLTLIPLDSIEAINQSVLNGLNDIAFKTFIDTRCSQVTELCETAPIPVSCELYSIACEDEKFKSYDRDFSTVYATNGRFRRAVINQTRSNLYPKLRDRSIKRNDPRIAELSAFLLHELAFKCFLGNERIASIEYGHQPIMPLWLDILDLKFPALTPFLQYRLDYEELEP